MKSARTVYAAKHDTVKEKKKKKHRRRCIIAVDTIPENTDRKNVFFFFYVIKIQSVPLGHNKNMYNNDKA